MTTMNIKDVKMIQNACRNNPMTFVELWRVTGMDYNDLAQTVSKMVDAQWLIKEGCGGQSTFHW